MENQAYSIFRVGYVSKIERDAIASISASSKERAKIILQRYLIGNGDKLVRIRSMNATEKVSNIEKVISDSGHQFDLDCVPEGFMIRPDK